MRSRVWLVLVVAVVVLAGCAGVPAPTGGAAVGYLDARSASSQREDGAATVVLPTSMQGATLLVAVAMGDGPGPGEANAQAQHSVLSDSTGRVWTERLHHIVYGSIVDVYTAPANGHDAGSTISSTMAVTHGDEGHGLTVLAYRHGHVGSAIAANGSFGLPHLRDDAPAGSDVLTAFVDGRQNTPAVPVPGFRPLAVLPVDGGPTGDRDLYQLEQLTAPGTWPGGPLVTGNTAPSASGYWGLVDITIEPGT
ncbi:hypothetical protein [Actinomycetospora sp. TBRC 11914]|uniref:hypothetical protein n=1 Tax=Actinomycetospora sp. TBRC 11914 TaxID=2729387 RepID=UPI00145CF4C9|nr:hypothetical protein [Actinomycetospora sp. TBRC 11914]NMO90323.1 hypothetical protein [Actinomycetospora sp. TBRC 11914]